MHITDYLKLIYLKVYHANKEAIREINWVYFSDEKIQILSANDELFKDEPLVFSNDKFSEILLKSGCFQFIKIKNKGILI